MHTLKCLLYECTNPAQNRLGICGQMFFHQSWWHTPVLPALRRKPAWDTKTCLTSQSYSYLRAKTGNSRHLWVCAFEMVCGFSLFLSGNMKENKKLCTPSEWHARGKKVDCRWKPGSHHVALIMGLLWGAWKVLEEQQKRLAGWLTCECETWRQPAPLYLHCGSGLWLSPPSHSSLSGVWSAEHAQ